MRKIIHADCDSFYASVEMRDDPALVSKPIAVGGQPQQRGVVATCNYIARGFGVHSAMPMSQAVRICPDLVIIPTNMGKYKAESARVQSIFFEFTDLVEPLSLDEAYLDVSDCEFANGSATNIAAEIRKRVRKEVGITISAGIAPNKFIAKIASDWNKPDGQFTVAPNEVQQFVDTLPVNKLFGVGSVTAQRMSEMQIHTCADLKQVPILELTKRFGKFGVRLAELAQGIDNRPVKTNRIRKSLSAERTYAHDLMTWDQCQEELKKIVLELEERIERAKCRSQITQRIIKVRFAGFETTTAAAVGTSTQLQAYQQLFNTAWHRQQKPVRLLGVGVKLSSSATADQLQLFPRE